MKTSIRVITAAAICLAAQGAAAQTAFGIPDCGEWLKDGITVRQQNQAWLLGYLSGLNFMYSAPKKDDPLDRLSSAKQAYAWMDNYCKANPLNHISAGSNELFRELTNKVKAGK